jgi:hypothetical protein
VGGGERKSLLGTKFRNGESRASPAGTGSDPHTFNRRTQRNDDADCSYSGSAEGPHARSMLLRYCSLSPAPPPVGHADESVAHQLQMPSLQQGGTRWRPVRKEVPRPVNCPRTPPAAPLPTHPFRCSPGLRSSWRRCRVRYVHGIPRLWAAIFVLHRQLQLWRSVSPTCCCVAEGAAGVPSNAKGHVSFKDCMSLVASTPS